MEFPNRSVIPHSCPDIGAEEIDALLACARSLHVKGGERVRALEQSVATDSNYVGAVATTTGSQAIHLALRAWFGGGKAVVGLPSYLCRSVYDAVCLAGCQPQLLDIDPLHFSISTNQTTRSHVDAVIVPHMFGIRAPIEAFLAAGLFVIEDCAQRIAPYAVSQSEPKAQVRILSFEATKLVTAGEGGILLADDPTILERARRLRDAPYDFPEPAVQLPLTDLQAAMALVQWQRLTSFREKRRCLADFYLRTLEKVYPEAIVPAMRIKDTYHFRFILQVDDPVVFLQGGTERGVMFRRPVSPMALHGLFRGYGDFPVTEEAFAHLVSIPLYPKLSEDEAVMVAEATVQALRQVLR